MPPRPAGRGGPARTATTSSTPRGSTLLGDYFPPAVTVRNTGPTRAVSIEYSIQIHTSAERIELGADEYLACEMHTTHAAEGFAVEDGSIWAPDGTLLATTRQTRLAG